MLRRLPDVLRARAEHMPDAPAQDDTLALLTFAAWDQAADAIGGGLSSAGVESGDRVLLAITNRHATVMAAAFVGAQRAGAIPVPTNTRLSGPELEAWARLTGAAWAIADVPDRIAHLPLRRVWTVDALPDDPRGLPEQDALDVPDADIVSTSGTTGRPKGVVFSHAELVDGVDPTAINRSKKVLHALPFTGFGGCHGVMLTPLRHGSCIVTQPRFDAGEMLRLIEVKQPDSLQLVPSMLRLLVDHPRMAACDVSSVRWIFTGTAPLPQDTMARVEAMWPSVKLINVYGMTEGGGGTQTRGRDSVRKPGSVGRGADRGSTSIRGEHGGEVPDGEVGEVWTRMKWPRRYWNDPEATAATWRDGWVRTGDLGYVDAEGDLILVGRSKELIIRGGYNIAPIEIEDVLHAHPAVLEAAVVGVEHDVLGEDVAAAVVVRTGVDVSVDELTAWCGERLADNKVPRVIAIVDELPYNQNAKVVKGQLRPMLQARADEQRARRRV